MTPEAPLVLDLLTYIEQVEKLKAKPAFSVPADFFVANQHYVFGDLKAWGWTVTIIGALELLVAVGVYAKNQFARWTGVLILSLNAIAQLLFIPAYPFWSLTIFTLDVLAIYGLVAYGSRISERA